MANDGTNKDQTSLHHELAASTYRVYKVANDGTIKDQTSPQRKLSASTYARIKWLMMEPIQIKLHHSVNFLLLLTPCVIRWLMMEPIRIELH